MDAMCELAWNRNRDVKGEENIDVCELLAAVKFRRVESRVLVKTKTTNVTIDLHWVIPLVSVLEASTAILGALTRRSGAAWMVC